MAGATRAFIVAADPFAAPYAIAYRAWDDALPRACVAWLSAVHGTHRFTRTGERTLTIEAVGEVQATGQTPRRLELDIAERLKNYISEPEVTVMVQQVNSQKFNVLGQVARPGSYAITNSPTVLDAIALAGGFRDFAKQKSIYVLRQDAKGAQTRLPFNYKEVIKGTNPAQNVKLQARDTVVVP